LKRESCRCNYLQIFQLQIILFADYHLIGKFLLPFKKEMSIKVEACVAAGNYLTIAVVLDFNMSLESIILWEIVASPAWIASGHEGTPGF
jgi:hypothetical protein